MWGVDNWGEMMWGGAASPLPLMSPLGFSVLVVLLIATGVVMQRRHAPQWAVWMLGTIVVVIPLAAYAGTIAMPNTFINGTVADATEVNQNFDALVVESNAQDGRITLAESGVATNSSAIGVLLAVALSPGEKLDLTDGGTTALHTHLSGPPSGPAGGGLTGVYPDPEIAANAVGGAQVLDESLTGSDIQDGSIANGDVTLDHDTLLGLADDDHSQYVLDAGDTMSGALTINADLTVTGQVACTGCSSFHAVESGPQNISSNTVTTVLYGTEVHDIASDYDPVAARYSAPSNGVYHFSASIAFVQWCGTATASAYSFLTVDGTRVAVLDRAAGNGTAAGFSLTGSITVSLLAAQTVEVQVLQECAGAPQQLDSGAGVQWNVLSGYRIH